MKTIHIIFISALFALLCSGCVKEPSYQQNNGGQGECAINIKLQTTSAAKTKVVGAKDGDAMNNIFIWIADGSGNIVYSGMFDGTSSDGDKDFGVEISDDKTTATASFINVERGDYKLYIVANLPSSLSDLASKTTIDNAFINAVLPTLNSDNKPPFTDADGMPLSTVQDIHVGPGINSISAELTRVCGRIRVIVRNNTTDKNIFLQSLSLTDDNPSKGYLFHKNDHSVPAGTVYNPFSSFEVSGTSTSDYIAPGDEKTYIDQYLYETGPGGLGTIGFEIAGGVFEDDVTEAEIEEASGSSGYTAGAEGTSFVAGQTYLIRNKSANYYLYVDGSSLGLSLRANLDVLLTDANLEKYLWTFSTTDSSPSYMKNVGSDRYLNLTSSPISLSDDPVDVTVDQTSDGVRLIYSYNGWYNYYLYSNSGYLNIGSGSATNTNRYWYLTPVTSNVNSGSLLKGALTSFSKVNDAITYLDKYGLPVTLESICRNEDVNVVINLFYSHESGVLYYTVDQWIPEDNETTFD